MTPGMLLDISDDYYFWHEGAYSNLQYSISPYLHPVLAKCAVELMSGLENLVEGEMSVVIRTKIGTAEFLLFCDEDEDICERHRYLTSPASKVVEVYCPMGAVWDDGYKNVRHRLGERDWHQRCLRVERGRGVRRCA
jgi:hypothetical protein